MSTTGVSALDRTVQQTQAWLGHIAQDLGCENHESSYAALKAVLHTLRDRLSAADAVALASQFPILVRGIYFEGWQPAGKPLIYRTRDEFLARVRHAAPQLPAEQAERAVVAVFRELATEIDWGESEESPHALPEEVRALWPAVDAHRA